MGRGKGKEEGNREYGGNMEGKRRNGKGKGIGVEKKGTWGGNDNLSFNYIELFSLILMGFRFTSLFW